MNSIKTSIQFFLRLFYCPDLYRDVAFREEGYGIQRLIKFLFLLMLPSLFLFIFHLKQDFQQHWSSDIKLIPPMTYHSNELFEAYQTPAVDESLKKMGVEWLLPFKFPSMGTIQFTSTFLLGTYNFFVKIPNYTIFGFQLLYTNNLYMPLPYTKDFHKPIISGETILNASGLNHLISFATMFWLMAFMMNSFFILIFVRTFGYLAPKMVRFFMRETLSYGAACRVLTVSSMIPMVILAMILNSIPYQEHYKYICIAMYMFNFYIAIRLISSKSISRWITPSA